MHAHNNIKNLHTATYIEQDKQQQACYLPILYFAIAKEVKSNPNTVQL